MRFPELGIHLLPGHTESPADLLREVREAEALGLGSAWISERFDVKELGALAGARVTRPWWMTALAAFCLLSVAFLVPRDLFFPETRDVEVWLGFELRGTAAWLTAPLHWAIFGIGAWGFWRARPWIVPCAASYAFYVALSHLIWSEVSPHGQGWPMGLAQAAVLALPGFLLLRARRS